MKLTNTQMDVLCTAFMEIVAKNIKKFQETSEYQEIRDKAKLQINYGNSRALAEEYKELTAQIKSLESRKQEILELFKVNSNYDPLKHAYFGQLTMKMVDNELQKTITELLGERFPTEAQVKSQIILMTTTGSENIIADLVKKYEMEHEE